MHIQPKLLTSYYRRPPVAMLFATLLLGLLVVHVAGAIDDDDESHPGAQEEKYRDLIKCSSCEQLVERIVNRTKKEPLGETVKLGTSGSASKTKRAAAATRRARAVDIVEGGCDSEGPRERIYCQDALGQLEDELVQLVLDDGQIRASPQMKEPKDLCRSFCGYKSAMQQAVEDMKQQARLMATPSVWEEAASILLEYWPHYLALFLGILGAGIGLQLWLLRRKYTDGALLLARQQQQQRRAAAAAGTGVDRKAM